MGATAPSPSDAAARAAARQRPARACCAVAKFDPAWEDLGKALEGISLPAVARAFGELATIARDLSAAVAEEDNQKLPGVQHG